MSDFVSIETSDTHALITMDDGKANALGFDMFEGLTSALDEAEKAEKVVLLAGRPDKFSAGFDLKVMGAGGSEMHRLLRTGAELSKRLLTFPTPVVLAVSGHALAMGALLCLSADYRVGMRGDFKLGLNEVAIGMTLPWFGIELARNRLEETRINAAVGLAQVYAPDEAVGVGYLDEVVESEALVERATALAAGFSTLNMDAHRATKARIREKFLKQLDQALERDFSDVAA